MQDIKVEKTKDFPEAEFEVDVDGSKYTVDVTEEYYKKLTRGIVTPEELIKESFRFLLEREPKESILKRFDLPTIHKYFPEFEVEIYQKEE